MRSSLIWVCTVCSDLSVPIFKIITVTVNKLQISNLENETATLVGYKSSNEKLEQETAELRDRINKLQSKLNESKANANVINNTEPTDNAMVSQLKEENEAAQHQVRVHRL